MSKGLKKFRAKKIFQWLYQKSVFDFAAMHNLSKADIALLEENFTVLPREITILREDLAKAQEEIDNQAEELEAAANRVAALEEEKKEKNGSNYIAAVEESELRKCLAMAEREAEIYKRLYEDLLARALG